MRKSERDELDALEREYAADPASPVYDDGRDLDGFLVLADAPAPAAEPAAEPVQLALLPAADSTVAATGLLF